MIVLTLNSGSTSVKRAAFEASPGRPPTRLSVASDAPDADPERTLAAMIETLPSPPRRIAHRVVHGGTRFVAPTPIDEAVVAEIGRLSELAPLHNARALRWIEAASRVFGSDVLQVAVFDTAFFADLPRVAAEYALPARFGVELGVRRYGFHGLAHESLWRRWSALHPELPGGGRLITLQLGGGCSIAALDRGRPIDVSMGFSPLEGLVMATRSGDVDPAVVPFLARRLATTSEDVVERLNLESGLAGVSGISGDPAVLLADDSPSARFALELYCYRARRHVGASLAVLGGCDGLVFGGGVGEHVPAIREGILTNMDWAGIALDGAANRAAIGGDARIGRADSIPVDVLAIDEETALVEAALALPDRG